MISEESIKKGDIVVELVHRTLFPRWTDVPSAAQHGPGRITSKDLPLCQGLQAQERADLGYVVRSLDPW
jgi:hypothetical protein